MRERARSARQLSPEFPFEASGKSRSGATKEAPMRRMLAIVGGAGAVVGALLAFLFDKDGGRRRRKLAVDRTRGFFNRRARQAGRASRAAGAEVYGVAMKATHLREQRKPQPDDATLARKVE